MPRKHHVLTALIALFGMLFMQLAVASYACPGFRPDGSQQTMIDGAASMKSMPGCDQPDPVKPALCHAHCMDGKFSLDKPEPPVASPAAVIVAAIIIPIEPLLQGASSGSQPDFSLSRITSPPIAIRHCCFRI